MASIVLLRHVGSPPAGRAGAPQAWPAAAGGRVRRLASSLAGVARRALARRELGALTDRQLRDIGLVRHDVADPLEACRRAQAWGDRGTAGWVPKAWSAARR